jgi:hypothetical protein
VGVAFALFLGVSLVRVWFPAEEAVTALFVFPISLLAMTFGLRGGLVAGVVALSLTAAEVALTTAELSVIGWLVRLVSLLTVGALLGRTADNLARAQRDRHRLELAAERHRQAVEVNDSLVQGMSVAKWAIEAGRTESGLATLNDTIVLGQELVSGLVRDAEDDRAAASDGRRATVPTVAPQR